MQTILCVRRSSLEDMLGGIPLGFTSDARCVETFRKAVGSISEWRPRGELEEDPTFLQVVVQGLVTRGGQVLCLFRAVRSQRPGEFVETRHNARIALSAGGHVEPVEADASDILQTALLRELEEELVFTRGLDAATITPLGIICHAASDAAMFQRVHIGIVYHVPVTGEVSLPPGSTEFDRVEFVDAAGLRELFPRMEGWGQLLATAISDRVFVV